MRFFTILFLTYFMVSCSSNSAVDKINDTTDDSNISYSNIDLYLTNADKSELFQFHKNSIPNYVSNINFSINVNPNVTYQEIDGFGFSLTGGSALHLNNMSSTARSKILNDLFSENGIGVSYLRVSIGASDLDAEVFSYNDLQPGQTDVNLNQFSIQKDKENLIPVLKEILAINPDIKIMGSPWSAPVWMKDNNNSIGGSLKPEYYEAYAHYFIKYIQAYQQENITIDAITIQNEPHHDSNNPSMYMNAGDQAEFIKNHLGPKFESKEIKTKIIVWDHNADNTSYPISIYNDAEANKFIDGAAFHLYAGDINNLSSVHNTYPNKNLYFTEQWVGANSNFADNLRWHTKELIIGATRNWCKTVLEWNLAADSNQNPHTIDGNNVTKNDAYYIIAHASKLVRPGSFRISSNYTNDLPNVAFKTPKNEIIVIVLNNTSIDKSFNINVLDQPITTSLKAGAVGTYVWKL